MNRAERRRAEREKQKGYSPSHPATLSEAVTKAVERQIIRKQARDQAILATSGPMLETVYAAVILLMTEEYGFTHEQCVDLLEKLEDKTLYCFEHEDILKEAFEKTGIIIHFNDAIDRIEEVD